MTANSLAFRIAALSCVLGLSMVASGQSGGGSRIKEVRPGVYTLDAITMLASAHEIHFPAEVNMATGLIEYALVHQTGKVHESLLSTEVGPRDLNVALLLVKPKNSPSLNVRVALKLSDDAPEIPIENWIRKSDVDAAMTIGTWTYQGSRVEAGVFVAERDGSVVAIIEDRDAIVGNPREGSGNDEIWEVVKAGVPKVGTPVEVVIRFEQD